MEKARRAVSRIAYTPTTQWMSTLSPSDLSLIPLLSFASSLYSLALFLRRQLYRFSVLPRHRLPVPVISVGNLTWGGNGKTPMVEFLARSLAVSAISPLILTRGYGNADEAKMLQRKLRGTSAKIGVGADRAAVAARFLAQYGYMKFPGTVYSEVICQNKRETLFYTDEIGAAILDDGMQHWTVCRDLEIVMVNALMPWGNYQLLPLGPLREPLHELNRADIIVIHHSDLVPQKDIEALESTIWNVKQSLPIFFTKMTPTHFFAIGDVSSQISLKAVDNMVVLCLSGIGSADSFVKKIEKMGPIFVDHLSFSDHHLFELKDIELVKARLEALESKISAKPIVVTTEKDYDRAPQVFEHLKRYQVLVLCCHLQFVEHKGCTEEGFIKNVTQHLTKYYHQE